MRQTAIALALLLLLCPALAEGADGQEICWTTLEDACYHLDEYCGGEGETRYPLSVEAALAFDKLPCPDCAGGAESAPEAQNDAEPGETALLTAAARAGTWVFCAQESALRDVELNEFTDSVPLGDDLEDALTRLYCSTIDDAMDVRLPFPDDALLMCLRRVGDRCCFVLRPDVEYSDENPLTWRVQGLSLPVFGASETTVYGVSDPMTYAPDAVDAEYTQVFSEDYGGIDIAVYRAMDLSIAVLHREASDAAHRLALFEIGVSAPAIPVAGYASGDTEVYCCVITDAELGALVAGAKPSITPVDADRQPDDADTAAEGAKQ